jgi:hypothetical protein
MGTRWRNEYRRCERCNAEYRPQREAQSYCNRDCRRQAAYGRERFKNGTKGRRKRRLEASDKDLGTLVAGSFRNGDFSSIETAGYKPANWIEKLNQRHANEIDRAYRTREKRKWPVDLMGGARHSVRPPTLTVDPKLRQTILDTERVLKDVKPEIAAPKDGDLALDCYDDGYPKLPTCLDQRSLRELARAA